MLNGIPHIMFANAKGGVGKTTVTALMSLAYAEAGFQVGVRDTDVEQRSLSHLLQLPAFVNKPAIKPAPPGTPDVGIVLIDCPPRLTDHAFISAVSDADLVCLVTMPSMLELMPTAMAYARFRKEAPKKRVCILINSIEPNRRLARELEENLEKVGLGDAYVLKNRLERREQYRHALINGWQHMDPDARERVAFVATELYHYAIKQ